MVGCRFLHRVVHGCATLNGQPSKNHACHLLMLLCCFHGQIVWFFANAYRGGLRGEGERGVKGTLPPLEFWNKKRKHSKRVGNVKIRKYIGRVLIFFQIMDIFSLGGGGAIFWPDFWKSPLNTSAYQNWSDPKPGIADPDPDKGREAAKSTFFSGRATKKKDFFFFPFSLNLK